MSRYELQIQLSKNRKWSLPYFMLIWLKLSLISSGLHVKINHLRDWQKYFSLPPQVESIK